MQKDKIVVKGAKEHNLKNIDIELPRDKFIVLTGLSGSGKSSLAFDTIYAEGQRRYVESLSAYARQFLGQMEKPNVEYIEGLSPAISIDQKTTNRNPRSTVGTVTEIYDYFRLLFARIGTPHCPKCGQEITSQTIDQMVDKVLELEERTKIQILSPIIRGKKGQHKKLLESIRKEGFVRVRIDGKIYDINELDDLEKNKKHTIEIVVDRIIVKKDIEKRLTDSIETALELAEGLVIVNIIDGEDMLFSQNFACVDCGIALEEISPRMFSFNSPFGMCPTCNGLGNHKKVDEELVIPNKNLSLSQGAIAPYSGAAEDTYYYQVFKAIAEEHDFDMNTPLKDAPNEMIKELLYGTKGRSIKFKFDSRYSGNKNYNGPFEGVINNLERRYRETNSDYMRDKIENYMGIIPCGDCSGARLRDESLAVTIDDKNISQVTEMSIKDSLEFFKNLELTEREAFIAHQILKEINGRLGFLSDVGLEYLTLSRSAGTLSGGESQRIRLATQIGSSLVGVLYVLDEPSIGLHQRDNDRLLKTLRNLTELGNTLLVVEHDEDTMFTADHIVDIGPGAGVHGGEIVSQGTVEEIMDCKESITGQYLTGEKKIEIPNKRRETNGNKIKIIGASENNLKNIDVNIPIGVFSCVTGVSGSGKSTLVNEILYKRLGQELHRGKYKPGSHKDIEGIENIDKVIDIDQSPIGRTPRSNPATYTGLFDYIRDLFAMTTEAKMKGYKKGRFSFNVKGGRCEACSGDGIIKIEMHFLPDVYVPCEVCKGKRYNRETLQVKYKGKTISDVLEMTVEEALEFFDNIPKIKRKLKTMNDVGLGYIHLGQPSTQLSGGEAQRIKLATELSKRSTGKTLYILDEPTTGLHFADIHKLIQVLDKLVEGGNTVLVIEHNLDVIKVADHIIDLGPEGGDNGGTIVTEGTPEEVAKVEGSYTGHFLNKILKK
ncbi:excinuclease ABC subunit UvrA [Clostridium sp. D2Q-11]|uniref:UvrABC system protein A n=1 Tax=Anaeromonas frigoriresistens TaxID=2683708 RepID=A0A942UTZ8_9FIRM|nr:excinuclease ABC subunit UvrA [Anaeromonas frigoriresistens]MBS4537415.1 excinuclease ABC subunit UvrA [Anaeromonas frigoriresistens]